MIKVKNKEYKSRVEKYLGRQQFMKHVGITMAVIEAGRTEAELIVGDIHKQQKGLLHGGVVATIADIVAGFAAYTLVPETHNVVTGEIKISYLRPGTCGKIVARGTVLKPGAKISFCEAEVFQVCDGMEQLIAKASTSMVILPPKD